MKTKNVIFSLSILVGLFFAPLVLRVLAADALGLAPSIMDMRSSALDFLIVGIVMFVFNYLFSGRTVIFTAIVIALFGLLTVCYLEFVRVFGEPLAFTQAGYILDPTFFFGSAIKVSTPWAFPIYAAVIAGVIWSTKNVALHTKRGILLSAVIGCAAFLLLPNDSNTATWRQLSVLQHSSQSILRAVAGSQKVRTAPVLSAEAIAEVENSLKLDLDGELLIAGPLDKPNILLIVMESVAGPYLPSIAEYHGVQSDVKMRNLDAFANRGLSYSRFMTHQVQTTRGTYALLCGDLPRFSMAMPKLELAAIAGVQLDCLPNLLREAGYATSYLQSAPLSFSRKDVSMPLIGFEKIQGAEWFGKEAVGTGWGVGDNILFEAALEQIAELDSDTSPWFLTLLNVGTHHPFDRVPKSFEGSSDPKTRSFEYLDYVFGEFLRELEAQIDLANTIVIVTSDEAAGLKGSGPSYLQSIARNWGMMTLVHSSIPSRQENALFGQIDLQATIFDLLGLATKPEKRGRSLVRTYKTQRLIYAYHIYGDLLYELSGDGIKVCETSQNECSHIFAEDGRFGSLKIMEKNAEMSEAMLAAIQVSEDGVSEWKVNLSTGSDEIVLDKNGGYIGCCQYLKLASGSAMDVEIMLEVAALNESVNVHFDIVSNKNGAFTTHFKHTENIESSGVFKLNHAIIFKEYTDEVEARLHISRGAKVKVNKAMLRIHSP